MAHDSGSETLPKRPPRYRRELRLGWVLVIAFAILSVLPLVGILAYGYRRNQAAITASLDVQLARNTQRDIHRIGDLIDGVTTAISIVSEAVEAAPALFDLADHRIAEALAHRQPGSSSFRFTSSTGEELAVAAVPFRAEFGRSWQIIIVAPTADFVGELQTTNRTVFALIGLAIAIELLLIYLLSRYIGRQIARISELFNAARRLSFTTGSSDRSFINELADLQGGFALLQNALSSFAKFVPADVVTQFIESGEPLAPGVKPQAATIFFCDLEGFSSHAEALTPNRLLAQLTQYFAIMTGAIAGERGTVDKFIGDAVMAFWGATTATDDHALRACTAAIRAKRRMDTLQATWLAEGQPVMKVRIGLHSSTVLVGNIGSPERLSYTAIGDGVNVASRLEGMNKELGTSVCVSEVVVSALGSSVIARPLRPIRVKGRRQELMVYELLAIADTSDPELMPRDGDLELVTISARASALRSSGDRTAAADVYRDLLGRFPDDKVTQLLLAELVRDR